MIRSRKETAMGNDNKAKILKAFFAINANGAFENVSFEKLEKALAIYNDLVLVNYPYEEKVFGMENPVLVLGYNNEVDEVLILTKSGQVCSMPILTIVRAPKIHEKNPEWFL